MGTQINQEEFIKKTNAMIQALDNTGVRMFMYYPPTRTILVPEKTCEAYRCQSFYANMPDSFAEDFVYEEDYPEFKEMYYKINRGEKTATAVFHSKDLNFCIQVTLTTVSWTKDGKPEDVFGLVENRSDLYKNEKIVKQLQDELISNILNDSMEKEVKTVAAAIGSQYLGVYHICLTDYTFVCFQEQINGVIPIIGKDGNYKPAWNKYITNYVDEKDRDGMREFMEITTLAERIGEKNSISYDYRRKNAGWLRGQFIVGQRDATGKPITVIYTASDINEEMETKRKKNEAEQEALHDPMTKLWNRKAFEEFKESKEFKNNQSGIVLFDIDRFKGINDQFGHEVGDQVIIAIANEAREILRRNDLVFRMGGDEFAILLYNCSGAIWNNICRKIETIHTDIKGIFPQEMNVTISAGLCISEIGYCDQMYKLADQALYNTKVNGRGGCTFINLDGTIEKEWHDNSGFLRKGDILEKNSTVTWRVDKPKKAGLSCRAYGDELFRAFLGCDHTASPEELYQAWKNGVGPDYYDVIRTAEKLAITDGKVDGVIDWKHPEKGMMQLRCSGSFEAENDDYYTFIGYIHVITGTHMVTMEDIDSKVKDALEEMYLCNYYVRLSDYSFKPYKIQPYLEEIITHYANALEAANTYVQTMLTDEYQEVMTEFMDLTTLKQRLKDTNYVGIDYTDPNIGRARAKFVVVERDENGEVETVLFIVETIQ